MPNSFDQRFGPLLAKADALRAAYKLIWIGCGSEDIFLDGNTAFAERLKAAGIPHVFRQFDGPHSITIARLQLAELLPQLFKPRLNSSSTAGAR